MLLLVAFLYWLMEEMQARSIEAASKRGQFYASEGSFSKSKDHAPLKRQRLIDIDPNFAFYEQRVFRWAIRLPLYLSGFAVLILFASADTPLGREFQLDNDGIKEFLSLYQFVFYPFSIMTALGVLVARFHASRFNRHQLEKAEAKNDFDRRFKHEEEFFKHIENYRGVGYLNKFEVRFLPGRALYPLYFKNNVVSAAELSLANAVVERKVRDVTGEVCRFLELVIDKNKELSGGQSLDGIYLHGMRELVKRILYFYGIEYRVEGRGFDELSDEEILERCTPARISGLNARLMSLVGYASRFMARSTELPISLLIINGKRVSSLLDSLPKDVWPSVAGKNEK